MSDRLEKAFLHCIQGKPEQVNISKAGSREYWPLVSDRTFMCSKCQKDFVLKVTSAKLPFYVKGWAEPFCNDCIEGERSS